MIQVIARILASEGQRQELLDAFAEIAVTVLQEEGCIAYEPMVDAVTDIGRQEPLDDDAVTLFERWETLEHLMTHVAVPHMVAFREKNGHLIRSAELRICESKTS
ncbi:MAG: putative quinol monooxygenase [Lentisphaeria bacterium]|nr:putative quinol monooxygenase [Lentisphaeria bacterium]